MNTFLIFWVLLFTSYACKPPAQDLARNAMPQSVSNTKGDYDETYQPMSTYDPCKSPDGQQSAGSPPNCAPTLQAAPPAVDSGRKNSDKELQKCVNEWHRRNMPINTTQLSSYAVKRTPVVVFYESILSDTVNTSPNKSILLIRPRTSVFGSQRWDLLNPSGLYCVVSSTNVLSKLKVRLAQGASLTVVRNGGVNVLSTNNSEVNGVNVLSDIDVEIVNGSASGNGDNNGGYQSEF